MQVVVSVINPWKDVALGQLTTVRALSSASSFRTTLTVEYKIGLAQPANPNAYHATNFNPCGMYQIVIHMPEKMHAPIEMEYMTHDG